MTCGVSVLWIYGWGQLLDPIIDAITGKRNFNNWNVENLEDNKLSAENWDKLMDDLQEWTVPEWAVMAFEWSCPEWWNPYTPAEGRFILWAGGSYSAESFWWNEEISLKESQLPSHYHYIARVTDYQNTNTEWACGNAPANAAYYLSTSSRCDWNYDLKFNSPSNNIISNQPNGWRTNTVWNWNPINIMNPYVSLHYCIKGKEPEAKPKYYCNWNPGVWTKKWNNYSESKDKADQWWKYTSKSTLWDCEYTCDEPWYIREGGTCVLNTYRRCCKGSKVVCTNESLGGPFSNDKCEEYAWVNKPDNEACSRKPNSNYSPGIDSPSIDIADEIYCPNTIESRPLQP